MPQGNNKKKRANPKKKGKNDRLSGTAHEDAINARDAVAGGPSSHRPTNSIQFLSEPSTFQSHDGVNGRNQPGSPMSSNTKESLYARYKNSTQRMKDKLESIVPPEIFQTDSVSNLLDATDYVVEHNMEVDHELLSDLKLSIRVRKQIAHEIYRGGDEGHLYFISVLEYCWSYLNPLRKKKAKPPPEAKEEERGAPSLQNRFEKLFTEDDGGNNLDEEEDENDLACQPQPRPKESGTTRFTLSELVAGSIRSDCQLFLLTLDQLMESHALQFADLQTTSSSSVRPNGMDTSVILPMMQASVAANLAIQQVHSLEQMLTLAHPHLSTVYRVLATVCFDDLIVVLTEIVRQKSPIASQFSERDAVEALGDAMECLFKSRWNICKRTKWLVKDFLDHWRFSDDKPVFVPDAQDGMSVQQVFLVARNMLRFETAQDQEWDALLENFPDRRGTTSHSWFKAEFIGGNRSIMHTIRLVQWMDGAVMKMKEFGKMVKMDKSCYGVSWGDCKKPVSRIQSDMDGLLVDIILPSLFDLCSRGIMKLRLPYENELASGFVHLKSFVDNPERPISWALVFTVHTILTSIFVTQESKQTEFLAEIARSAFDSYVERLDWVEKTANSTIPRRPPIWEQNLIPLSRLQWLVRLPTKLPRDHVMLAVWNPYCAGTFLSFIAFHGNLEGGALLVDETAQLRMTLHLFNALTQANAIPRGKIVLLEGIWERFETCRAIWDDSPPEKGKYQEQWWMSIGMTARKAQQISASRPTKLNPTDMNRELTYIEIDLLSKSFRQVCLHDFRGVVDMWGIAKRDRGNEVFYEHMVRTYDTMNAMADDSVLLGTNLILLGFYLNEFCIDLFKEMGWMPLIEKNAREGRAASAPSNSNRAVGMVEPWEECLDFKKHSCMHHYFGQHVMAKLDEGDAALASQLADFMVDYFSRIDSNVVNWFAHAE